jgi:hypothetical protein
MEPFDRLLPVEDLTPMRLAGDGDTSLTVKVLKYRWMLRESPLLLPAQHRGVGEIKGHRHLRFDLIDVLPPWTTRASERQVQFVLGDRQRPAYGRCLRGAAIHTPRVYHT